MTNQLIKFLCVLLLATNVVAGGDDRDSGPVESLDEVVVFDPCTDDGGTDTMYTSLVLSSDSGFVGGEIISAESGLSLRLFLRKRRIMLLSFLKRLSKA